MKNSHSICKITETRGRCKVEMSVFLPISRQVSAFEIRRRDNRLKINICDMHACIPGRRASGAYETMRTTTTREERERETARNARNATGPSMISSRIPSGPAAPVFRDPSSLVTSFRAEGEVRHVDRRITRRVVHT